MKIYLGADHAGFEMKEHVKEFLTKECGYIVEDKGAATLDPMDDYPDFVAPVAQAVSQDPNSCGIIFGGSGQGEAMVANRIKGVRCAVYYGGPQEILALSREHNDANILSLGARFVSLDQVNDIVRLWLTTQFTSDERHVRRIAKL